MDGASRTWVDRLPLIVLAVLAAGFLALGVAEAWADAPTFDEPVYVSAGLAAVLHHDVTLNDEHPPLAKMLVAIPLLWSNPPIDCAQGPVASVAKYGGTGTIHRRTRVQTGSIRRQTGGTC